MTRSLNQFSWRALGRSPHAASRAALLAGVVLLGVATLLGCAGAGDTLVPPPATDNYIIARATVIDATPACTPLDCREEFFNCQTALPVPIGTTYDIRCNLAAAGFVQLQTGPNAQFKVTLSGTDTATFRGVALEFSVRPMMGDAIIFWPAMMFPDNANYVDLDFSCTRVNSQFNREMRFLGADLGPTSVTLSQVPVDGMGIATVAQPDGSGGFSPGAVIEGSFTFVAANRQETLLGPYSGQVRVDGCFRVNLPFPERAVPVTSAPSSMGPGCP